jgi:hypothetical protein
MAEGDNTTVKFRQPVEPSVSGTPIVKVETGSILPGHYYYRSKDGRKKASFEVSHERVSDTEGHMQIVDDEKENKLLLIFRFTVVHSPSEEKHRYSTPNNELDRVFEAAVADGPNNEKDMLMKIRLEKAEIRDGFTFKFYSNREHTGVRAEFPPFGSEELDALRQGVPEDILELVKILADRDKNPYLQDAASVLDASFMPYWKGVEKENAERALLHVGRRK